MQKEVLEGDALAEHIERLGSDYVGLTLEGRLYRNVQNKQNIAVIIASLGEFCGVGFAAKASVDEDLGDDATVLLAVGRALGELGLQIEQHIHDGIEARLATNRAIESMQEIMRDMIGCESCSAPEE